MTTPDRGLGAQQALGVVSLAADPAGRRAGRARILLLPWSGSFWGESGKLWAFIVRLEQVVGEVKQGTLWWSLCSSHLSCFPLCPQGFVPLSVPREDGLVSSTAPGQQPCIELFSIFRLLLFLHEYLPSSPLCFCRSLPSSWTGRKKQLGFWEVFTHPCRLW